LCFGLLFAGFYEKKVEDMYVNGAAEQAVVV
jgi:hypothetical protein